MRIERTTSPLPRECSTTELQERGGLGFAGTCFVARRLVYNCVHTGLSYKNTRLASSAPNRARKRLRYMNAKTTNLERENGIEPSYAAWKAAVLPLNYSRAVQPEPTIPPPNTGGESWIRTSVLVRGQIYSLLPLTTRPSLHGNPALSRLSA
jgi:hypothetical protein